MTASAGTPECGRRHLKTGTYHIVVCLRSPLRLSKGNGFPGELVTPYACLRPWSTAWNRGCPGALADGSDSKPWHTCNTITTERLQPAL